MNGPAETIDPRNYDDVCKVAAAVRASLSLGDAELPEIGIICGSGLGGLAATVESPKSIAYKDVPGFPETHVKGHKGELVFGVLGGRRVVCMAGRFHPYEGHDLAQCVLPVRVMKILGVHTLVVTNAAGGLNPDFQAGDLMMIKDHIGFPLLTLKGPLMGLNDDRLGPRFPSLNNAYDRELRSKLSAAAASLGESMRCGVFAMCGGPQFETPAELRALRVLGVDAVGMSVVHEAVAARHAGLKVVAFSLITNISDTDPDSEFKANLHEEVLEAGRLGAVKATAIVNAFLKSL